MKLIINKDRSVIPIGTWGTVNENDFEILDFEFPEELDGYNKRIVYYLDDERVWDTIVDNKAYITNAITTKGDVKAYVWCTKENTEREADTDFRTMLFEMHFYENENADGIVPTEQQVDGFNTMLTAMNAKIDEVDALEQTIETAEAQRQEAEATRVSNENTRESNESTRQTNEQTRQSQEAERERRTDEAIGNIEDKTAEYNSNAEEKTEVFNTNATQKTNDFNSNYTQKVNDFNTNASSKELAFNSNAESKTSTFNTNATNKTNDFNSNASSKTNTFNSNASSKTTDFNTNAENKTSAFNTNASDKTSDFNTNAGSKTNTFNDNATQKTTAFNNNAQAKTEAFDEHTEEMQQEIDELSANMPWNETEQATEISVDDAAKYSKNKLELFGNTEQASYTGKNFIDYNSLKWGYKAPNQIADSSFCCTDYIEVAENTTYIFSHALGTKEGRIIYYDENKSGRGLNEDRITTAFVTPKNCKFVAIAPWKKGTISVTNEPWMQLEQGSTATDYEPYTGGQPSPSPDYPQDIHVVTGNNTISIGNTNYPINLGNIELCKIGNYQDYLYKENGNWYKYGAIGKLVLKGSESIYTPTTPVEEGIKAYRLSTQSANFIKDYSDAQCSHFKVYTDSNEWISATDQEGMVLVKVSGKVNIYIRIKASTANTTEELQTFLYNNNIAVNYIYATPVITQITDETLIAQLDAIYEHLQLVKGTNNITITAADLAPYMKLSYMQDLKSKLDNLDSRLSLLE